MTFADILKQSENETFDNNFESDTYCKQRHQLLKYNILKRKERKKKVKKVKKKRKNRSQKLHNAIW